MKKKAMTMWEWFGEVARALREYKEDRMAEEEREKMLGPWSPPPRRRKRGAPLEGQEEFDFDKEDD